MESLANLDIGQSDSEAGREWSKACTELEPAFAMARQAQAGGALGRILERLTHCMSMLDDDPDCGFQDVIQEEILNEYLADAQACPECSPVYVREITRELERLRINASIKSEFVDGDSGCQILKKVTDRIRNLATDLAKQRPDGMAINLVDRKVFLLEFTRASDYDPDFVSRTDSKKRARYSRSVNELKKLLPGWETATLCFTVGVRGTIPQAEFERNLGLLGVAEPDVAECRKRTAADTFQVMHDMLGVRAHCMEGFRAQANMGRQGQRRFPVKPRNGLHTKNVQLPRP